MSSGENPAPTNDLIVAYKSLFESPRTLRNFGLIPLEEIDFFKASVDENVSLIRRPFKSERQSLNSLSKTSSDFESCKLL